MPEVKCCTNILQELPFSSPIYGHLTGQNSSFQANEHSKITFHKAIGSDGETKEDAMETGKQEKTLVKNYGSK